MQTPNFLRKCELYLVVAETLLSGGHFNGDLACSVNTDQIQKLTYPIISGTFFIESGIADLQVEVPRQTPEALRQTQNREIKEDETTQYWSGKVKQARELQNLRQQCLNSEISVANLETHCAVTEDDHEYLLAAMEKLQLSHRAYHRTLRLARTIADLEEKTEIQRVHLSEALSYRALDTLFNRLKEL